MFETVQCYATIATKDVDGALGFWTKSMGFTKRGELGSDGSQKLEGPGGQVFCLYPSQFAGTAQHTVLAIEVRDVPATVAELRTRGVQFEEYDLPGLKTVDGVATMGELQAAWFKDPDGNILSLVTPEPALV